MKAPKFREFISEAPDNGKYKLLVITDEPEKAKTFLTADRLREEAEKLGWKYYLYKLTGGYTTSPEGALRLHNKDDDKGFEVSGLDTIAIIRGSVTRKDSWMDIVSLLEKHSICVVNSRETISVCADKYRTSLRLADYGVKQPVTHLVNDPENSEQAFENLNTQYPIILKTLRGSKGVGVLFVESAKALDSIVQLIHKQDEDADLLLQEYIKLELTELEIEESLKAAKAVNGLWTAVDFIPSKNRTKEPPFIIEVNSSPGTEGMEEATGRNISKEILEFFADKKNWVKVPGECGYKEIVTIKPFGEIIAKFDTGNSGMSVIHADKMDVKGKKVTWSLLDKTITSDIIRTEEISVGGLRDYEETRYVIKLNVEFLGSIYETEFTLDDREDRTPILFDREFMSKVNVMVNPDRKYVVTTKYSLD